MKYGVAVVHYNRLKYINDILDKILLSVPPETRVVLCDDGSNNLPELPKEIVLVRGNNLGVGYNKNRALFALQDCNFIAIVEDDLIPTEKGWIELYEEAAKQSGIHHFCRVQDKTVTNPDPALSDHLQQYNLTPIYGQSPRGDFTFITRKVIQEVGGFNPTFKGSGYAHGEWSNRVFKAGLIPHPLKWIDIVEGRDKFKQVGDREGGRWDRSKRDLKVELMENKKKLIELEKNPYIYHPLILQ